MRNGEHEGRYDSRIFERHPVMTESLRDQWRRFAALPSGQRFQQRYRQHREKPAGMLRKIIIIAAGLVLVVLGLAMLVLPGPGVLAIVMGAALIAEESLVAARVLDRIDLWISRRIARWRERRADKSGGSR